MSIKTYKKKVASKSKKNLQKKGNFLNFWFLYKKKYQRKQE